MLPHNTFGHRNYYGTQRQQSSSFITLIGLYIDVDKHSRPVVDPDNDFHFVCKRDQDFYATVDRFDSHADDRCSSRKFLHPVDLLSSSFRRSLVVRESLEDLALYNLDSRTPAVITIQTWYFPWYFSTKHPHNLLKSCESQTVKSLFNTNLLADMADNNSNCDNAQHVDETIKEYLRQDEPEERITEHSFVCGNPNVEVIQGIVRLYRENLRVPSAGDYERSDLICMLNVPSNFTCADLLHFFAPFNDTILYVRILSIGYDESVSSAYMVLVKFRTQNYADRFYNLMNGNAFSSLEQASRCQLAYVACVDYTRSTRGKPPLHMPYDADQRVGDIEVDRALPSDCTNGDKPFSSFNSSFTELPMCIVCLERMDEAVDGIVTILCNHSFHSNCLARGIVVTCPVCRYFATPHRSEEQKCMQCDRNKDLWICLICGNIGCGRYSDGGHAVKHFECTSHTYAMNIESQRVWDYAGDNYVHRLIQGDGSPDKPVAVGGDAGEYSTAGANGDKHYGYNNNNNSNINYDEEQKESINLEFTCILTRTLEEQRLFFEKKQNETNEFLVTRISKLEQLLNESSMQNRHSLQQCSEFRRDCEALEKRNKQLTEQLQQVLTRAAENEHQFSLSLQSSAKEHKNECDKLHQEIDLKIGHFEQQCSDLRRERDSLDSRTKKLSDQLQTKTKDHNDQSQLNSILSLNIADYKMENAKLRDEFRAYKLEKDAQISELQEQVRDLMGHFQLQSNISQLDDTQREEVQEGSLEVNTTAPSTVTNAARLRAAKAKKRR